MDTQDNIQEMDTELQELTLNLEGNTTKKPVRKWVIISAIIAVLLAVALIVTIVLLKNRDKADEEKIITIIDVERQSNTSNSLSGVFGNEPFGQNIQIELDINDLALAVLEKQIPDLEILGDLDGLAIDATAEQNNGMIRFSLGVDYDEESIPPFDILIDRKTKCMYISSELFSGNYLKFDLESLIDEEFDIDFGAIMEDSTVDPEIHGRYFDDFLELMIAQETKTETLTANGVSQECTVYCAEIDVEKAAQLLLDYLNEIKGSSAMLDDVISPIIESVEGVLNDNEKSDTLYWYVYTDASGKIIGRQIAYDDEQILYWLCAVDGEEVGVDFYLSGLKIVGNGVLKDGLLDSTFIISEDDVDYIKISTEDFELEGLNTGKFNGTISIKPTDALLQDLFDIDISLPISLTFDFESKDDTQNVKISIMEIITLKVKTSQFEPETITLPEGNEINGEDTDAFAKLFDVIEAGEAT